MIKSLIDKSFLIKELKSASSEQHTFSDDDNIDFEKCADYIISADESLPGVDDLGEDIYAASELLCVEPCNMEEGDLIDFYEGKSEEECLNVAENLKANYIFVKKFI